MLPDFGFFGKTLVCSMHIDVASCFISMVEHFVHCNSCTLSGCSRSYFTFLPLFAFCPRGLASLIFLGAIPSCVPPIDEPNARLGFSMEQAIDAGEMSLIPGVRLP